MYCRHSLPIILLLIFTLVACDSEQAAPQKTEQILLLEHFETSGLYAVHLASPQNVRKTILAADEGYTLANRTPDYLDFSGPEPAIRIDTKTGERIVLEANQPVAEADLTEMWTAQILEQGTPISGPRDFYPLPTNPNAAIFSMTGPTDNYLNLYLIDNEGSIRQLTHVEIGADENDFLLSASAEFINWRPTESSQFLYRSRLRDGAGQDFNELHLYDLTENSELPAPYFGKNPVWSVDGKWLAGVRLNEGSPPLYILWRVELATNQEFEIGPGCNPAWSISGKWLAYDGHDNSQWQGYTDCYANGQVYAQNIETGEVVELSKGYAGSIQVIGWIGN
jgi:hypothetical protein